MATGFQGSNSNNVDVIVLIAGATAANTVARNPAVLSATPAVTEFYDLTGYVAVVGPFPPSFDIVIYQTAGSGVMTLGATRLLVAHKGGSPGAIGGPLGVGADATKGLLNNGAGFGEDGADILYHRETIVYDLNHADGLAALLGAIAGTATAIRVEAHIPKRLKG